MNRPERSLAGAAATLLALFAVAACDTGADQPAPPAMSSASAALAFGAQPGQEDAQVLDLIMYLKLRPEELANLSIEQIWSRAAGNRTMPENLSAAIERVSLRRAQGLPDLASPVPPSAGYSPGITGVLNGPPGPKPPPKLNLLPGPGPRPPPKLDE